MKAISIVKYILVGVIVAVVIGFLHYNLPRTAVVQITGTDTKRFEKGTDQQRSEKASRKADAGIPSLRDVRFINTVTREGRILVFRNENTAWGWPPYFKFDSADITAKAQSYLLMSEKPWIRVKYYGWRIHILSKYPNIISLKEVPRDYSRLPWFNIIFILLLLVGGLFAVRKIRGWNQRLRRRFSRSGKTEGNP
jgi:hypothetical protein